jgi:hypothetical protein
MTNVGHNLTGIALGIICLPKGSSLLRTSVHLLVFITLSMMPDHDIPGWGHSNYRVSHSLFVHLSPMGVAIMLLAWKRGWRARLGGWPVVICGGLAWMSHFLLDTFYNHGAGLAMFWPFSATRVSLPIPCFSTLSHGPDSFWSHNLRVYAVETACYGPLVLLALAARMIFSKFCTPVRKI